MKTQINIGVLKVINSDVFIKVKQGFNNLFVPVYTGQQSLFDSSHNGYAVKYQLTKSNRAIVFTIY